MPSLESPTRSNCVAFSQLSRDELGTYGRDLREPVACGNTRVTGFIGRRRPGGHARV